MGWVYKTSTLHAAWGMSGSNSKLVLACIPSLPETSDDWSKIIVPLFVSKYTPIGNKPEVFSQINTNNIKRGRGRRHT